MNTQLELMHSLQRWVMTGNRPAHLVGSVDDARAGVPAPVLAHFDRQLARGRKGVAEVVNGVCGGCHLRLPASIAARGATHHELELCENCGAYLTFPMTESAGPLAPARPRRVYRATAA